MATIDDLFRLMVEQKASDLHITSGAPPYLRVHGGMSPLNYRQLTSQDVQGLIFEILSEPAKPQGARSSNDPRSSPGPRN